MLTIDEWMTELAAPPPVLPEATEDGLDRLWTAILNDGGGLSADDPDSSAGALAPSVAEKLTTAGGWSMECHAKSCCLAP